MNFSVANRGEALCEAGASENLPTAEAMAGTGLNGRQRGPCWFDVRRGELAGFLER